MAGNKTKRRSRKARGAGSGPPRAVPSARRSERSQQRAGDHRTHAAAGRTFGTVGERPPSPFGGLPVSEIAIFVGIVGVVVGLIDGGGAALVVGAIVCALGVAEVTAREHFSGFRSHSVLLAAIPAVIVEAGIALVFGAPAKRGLLLVPALAVFGICFWLLRRSFLGARHARVVKPPSS